MAAGKKTGKRSRKKSGATRKTEHKNSILSWAFMAVLLAAFVAFLIHLDQLPEQGETTTVKTQPKSEKKSDHKQKNTKEHQFDFYTVLPDREVEVIRPENTTAKYQATPKNAARPKASQTTSKTAKTTQTKPSVSKPVFSNQLYQLQVGAFKELSKADAMKARLAFLGVESNIQVIRNNQRNNSQPMYRVRVGPSTDQKKMEQVKAQLKAQNINTFMQKL